MTVPNFLTTGDNFKTNDNPTYELSRCNIQNVSEIIKTSWEEALKQVNTQLIIMYMSIGKVLVAKTKEASYGDEYIKRISDYINEQFPGN